MGLFKRQTPVGTLERATSKDSERAPWPAQEADSLDRTALVPPPGTAARSAPLDVPSWPTGVVRFDGETLEFGAGETRRVHVSCLRQMEIKPPRGGRLSLAIAYQSGLNKEKAGVWVEASNETALTALVATVHSAMSGQAAQ